MSAIVVNDTDGLSTHANDLSAQPGSTSVADNVAFTREGRPERRPGFKDYSTNLPDFSPTQLLASAKGDQAYLHLDSGLWYNSSGTWYRKRGPIGGQATTPAAIVVQSGHVYYSAICAIWDLNLSTGALTVLAGRANTSGTSDGTGDSARFSTSIQGIASDSTNLYVCDTGNHTVRKIVISTGVVTTLAGTAGATGTTDANGASARFNNPYGIASDGTNLYVCDRTNDTIRRVVIAAPNAVTTIAGTAAAGAVTDGTGAAARFLLATAMCFDGTNLYVSDSRCIRKVAPPLTAGAAVVTTIAGDSTTNGSADGTGTAAKFNGVPGGLCFDGTNLYVTDRNNQTVRKVAPPLTLNAGVVTTPFGTVLSSGEVDGIGTSATFESPQGIAFDGTNLFVADNGGGSRLRKVYTSISYVTTISAISGVVYPVSRADGIIVGPD